MIKSGTYLLHLKNGQRKSTKILEILKLDESKKIRDWLKKLKAEYLHAGSYQGQITSGKRVGA